MAGSRDEIFSRSDELEAVGLNIPQITRLALLLSRAGLPISPGLYTTEAAEEALAKIFGISQEREGDGNE